MYPVIPRRGVVKRKGRRGRGRRAWVLQKGERSWRRGWWDRMGWGKAECWNGNYHLIVEDICERSTS